MTVTSSVGCPRSPDPNPSKISKPRPRTRRRAVTVRSGSAPAERARRRRAQRLGRSQIGDRAACSENVDDPDADVTVLAAPGVQLDLGAGGSHVVRQSAPPALRRHVASLLRDALAVPTPRWTRPHLHPVFSELGGLVRPPPGNDCPTARSWPTPHRSVARGRGAHRAGSDHAHQPARDILGRGPRRQHGRRSASGPTPAQVHGPGHRRGLLPAPRPPRPQRQAPRRNPVRHATLTAATGWGTSTSTPGEFRRAPSLGLRPGWRRVSPAIPGSCGSSLRASLAGSSGRCRGGSLRRWARTLRGSRPGPRRRGRRRS